MRHDTVRWRDSFYIGSKEISWLPDGDARRDRYDLASALRIVRRMETSAGRAAVFEEIKNKNALYRLVDSLYSTAGIVQPLLLFVYMLKSIVSVGPFQKDEADAVAVSNFDNEHHTIDRVAALVPAARLLRLSFKRSNAWQLGQWAAALRMLGSLPRVLPFLKALVQSHSFMPAARIASALAFYMRFSQLFAERPDLKAAVVASNYSPEGLGMAAAAHQAGRRVIYANHAPVPANGAVVPPVLADCAIFYGDMARRTYERRSRCTAEVALLGQPSLSRAMKWQAEVRTVGIFLTSGTRTDVLAALVSEIRVNRPDVRILIRNHPVMLLKNDLSNLSEADRNVQITIGNPLDDEVAACDLIICGNSGVALNAVSGGCPVAYISGLDRVKYDSNGFVESGLVCEVSGWSDDIYRRLQAFYQRAEWQSVMRSYDASYGADVASLKDAAALIVRRHLCA